MGEIEQKTESQTSQNRGIVNVLGIKNNARLYSGLCVLISLILGVLALFLAFFDAGISMMGETESITKLTGLDAIATLFYAKSSDPTTQSIIWLQISGAAIFAFAFITVLWLAFWIGNCGKYNYSAARMNGVFGILSAVVSLIVMVGFLQHKNLVVADLGEGSEDFFYVKSYAIWFFVISAVIAVISMILFKLHSNEQNREKIWGQAAFSRLRGLLSGGGTGLFIALIFLAGLRLPDLEIKTLQSTTATIIAWSMILVIFIQIYPMGQDMRILLKDKRTVIIPKITQDIINLVALAGSIIATIIIITAIKRDEPIAHPTVLAHMIIGLSYMSCFFIAAFLMGITGRKSLKR